MACGGAPCSAGRKCLWWVVMLNVFQRTSGLGHDLGPRGTVSALATQTRTYSDQVRLSYFEPVNCTLDFEEAVDSFDPTMLTKADTTLILNFEEVSKSEYTFQVSSLTNDANVTILIAPQTVQAGGHFNNETTAFFSFEFYAFPPSLTLGLDGYVAQSTGVRTNIAYLFFNSTTQYDEVSQWFNSTYISFEPALAIQDFTQVNDMMYRFRFRIEVNESNPAVECKPPGEDLLSDEHVAFDCFICSRPLKCVSETRYPPANVDYLEFPFQLVIQPIPELGLLQQNLTVTYDKLWAYVKMDAPMYANEPFYVTVTWSEPLSDLVAVQPVFGLSGPPVADQNLTIVDPTTFRLLIAPMRTGVLTITINGTEASIDLAGNTNDFRRNPLSRTGAQRIVIFSMGPPSSGQIDFGYSRPRMRDEYPPVYGFSDFASMPKPSLTVSWSGFVTAVRYDTWIRWGRNMSTTIVSDLNVTEHIFKDFGALLGVEYKVYIRAFNHWGQSITSTRVFLYPTVDIIADGSRSIASLPDLMSPMETKVEFNAIIPEGGFLSLNPLRVLAFRTINQTAGDQDPCVANTKVSTCTFVNFHMEVPASRFVIFRKPIRLQFIFGRQGWQDLYFRPRLSYWEDYHDEWRDVLSSCPPEQVFDRWNKLHRIYEVSVCHLSQFALFQDFEPPPATPAPTPPPRPESYENPAFFALLAGSMTGGIMICCVCYALCIRRRVQPDRPLAYSSMGIKSVSERLPNRRLGNSGKFSIQDAPRLQPEEMQPALAAEPAWAAEPEPAAEDEQPPLHPLALPYEPFALSESAEDTRESSMPAPLAEGQVGVALSGPTGGPPRGPPAGPPPGAPPIAPMSVLPGVSSSSAPAALPGEPIAAAFGAPLDLSLPGATQREEEAPTFPTEPPEAEAEMEPPDAGSLSAMKSAMGLGMGADIQSSPHEGPLAHRALGLGMGLPSSSSAPES